MVRRLLERALPWTACVAVCAGLTYYGARREQLEVALRAARDSFQKDRCHEQQGYRVGDVRGGISVTIPVGNDPFTPVSSFRWRSESAFGAVWLVGLLALVWWTHREDSAARQAHRANELRMAVFQVGGVGMIITSIDQKILDANPRVCELLGYDALDLLGNDIALLHHTHTAFPELLSQFGSNPGAAIHAAEYSLLRRDGETVWCAVTVSAIDTHDSTRGYLWGITDIGALRMTQESLIVTNQELILARDEALGAARIKTDFLANMSHEIRTPLHGILGMVEVLLRTKLTPEQAEYASAISRSGDGLLVVLNDILDYSKLEAGQLHLEHVPFSLQEEAGDVILLFRAQLSAGGVQLKLVIDDALPTRILGDAVRFRQILSNLVSNAVKFTPSGRIDVRLHLTSSTPASSCVSIEVADTGIGIPEAQRERLFLPFSQADNSTARRYGGTGLGLMLIKRLAEAMNGAVSLQSQAGSGSVFRVDLNLDNCVAPSALGAERATRSNPLRLDTLKSSRISVLIVEDVIINQLVAKKLLESAGAEVEIASNGREAVDACQKSQFDLILMDCQMPDLDGFEATKIIRQLELGTGHHVPIVAMTAGAMAEDRQRCLDAGMDDYISKPVTGEALVRCIIAWVEVPPRPT